MGRAELIAELLRVVASYATTQDDDATDLIEDVRITLERAEDSGEE